MKNNKFEKLNKYLHTLGKQGICLAFSGGIDSALLLVLCKDLNITAVTFSSPLQTEDEINFTAEFCKKYNVNQKIITLNPLEDEKIVLNPKERCYYCKSLFFQKIKEFAQEKHLANIIDGTNFDDLNTYRPGLKALKELGILSPFALFKITKEEIRSYAKSLGLEIFNKPSTPCLATRFPYDTPLELDSIERVKRSEKYLKELGFSENRVRHHGNIARIEIQPENFTEFLQHSREINAEFKHLDFPMLRSIWKACAAAAWTYDYFSRLYYIKLHNRLI